MPANSYFGPTTDTGSLNHSFSKSAAAPLLADDLAQPGIDLNEQLVKNRASTFFMRVNSNAMADAGILMGDVVVVDRLLEPTNGKIIIAIVDEELLIRRLEISGKNQHLVATKNLAALDVSSGRLKVWGVVTYVIRNV